MVDSTLNEVLTRVEDAAMGGTVTRTRLVDEPATGSDEQLLRKPWIVIITLSSHKQVSFVAHQLLLGGA